MADNIFSGTSGTTLEPSAPAPGIFGGTSADPATAQARAVVNISAGSNPDQAAKSIQIGNDLGVDPNAVDNDFDNFSRLHKLGQDQAIVNGNPALRAYVNSSPIHAKVSGDDWPTLDRVTNAVSKLSPGQGYEGSILQAAAKGFKVGVGTGKLGDWTGIDWADPEVQQKAPLLAALASTITGVTDPLEAIMRLTSGAITGATYGAQRLIESTTGVKGFDPDKAAQMLQDPGLWASLGPVGEMIGVPFEIAGHNAELIGTARAIKPFVDQGVAPPVGVHPLVDQGYAAEAELRAKNLEEALRESLASTTRERAPDKFAELVRHVTDGNIGISADAIRELYGDRVPEPGDNLLGFVPDLSEKLATAGGGDVSVPLADYLAYIDPNVAKQLADHVRIGDGITLAEAKELPGIEAYHGSPYEFEAFDTEHIGTGEGAQSYGYGHYVAENPEVARTYARDRGQLSESEPAKSSLYRVRITRAPEEFLDWNKPLSEQPQILERLKPLLEEMKADEEKVFNNEAKELLLHPEKLTGEKIRNLLDTFTSAETGEATSQMLSEAGIAGIKYLDQGSRGDINVHEMHESMQDRYGKYAVSRTDKTSGDSSILSGAGFDTAEQAEAFAAAERAKATRNFVVFSDKDLEVLDRNGEAVKAIRRAAALEPKTLSLPEGDVQPFETVPPGFTKQQYDLYLKRIGEKASADVEAAAKRALREQKRKQTKEWNDNRLKLRGQISDEVMARPEIAASMALRGPLKINPDTVTEAQREGLPKNYFSRQGFDVDQVATRYGFTTGDELVEALTNIENARKNSGQPWARFVTKMISDELDRQMEEKFGRLDQNILDEAKDQVLSAVQDDILHEQTMRLAEAAGQEYPIEKAAVVSQMREEFEKGANGEVSSNKLLAEAGRAGRATEIALLKKDPVEAFRQSQRQQAAIIKARMAKEVEDLHKKADKIVKRFSAQHVNGVEQDYTNIIQQIIARVYGPKAIKRSITDLTEEAQRKGIGDFVSEAKDATYGMNQMPVAEFLMNPSWDKNIKTMSVDEFRQVYGSMASLAKLGADAKKIIRAGEEFDLQQKIGEIRAELRTFPLKAYSATPTLKNQILKYPRVALASATSTETLFNRIDRNNPRGPANRFINYPLAAAANYKDKLIRQFSKPYQELGPVKNQKKLVASPLIDPLSITEDNPEGSPIANFNMGNLQVMVHNAGNPSNWRTFARGWGRDPDELMAWLQRTAPKEMWDRAQKMGDTLFGPAFELARDEYEKIYGWASEKLDLVPFQVTHTDGTVSSYEGWYHPLIPDPMREAFIDAEGNVLSKQSLKQRGGSVYDGPDNFHARTTNGYTKARTGAVYPIDLNPDMIPVRLTQMLHDIAFRGPIIEAEKIFRDQGFRNDMTKHYGKHYVDSLGPYLHSIAGETGYPSKAYSAAQRASEFFRQNVVGTYIGFNPSTPLKHGPTALGMSAMEVGPKAWAQATWDIYARGDEISDANKAWIDDTFEEVGRRRRFWQETLSGAHKDIYGKGTLRERFGEAGSWAVAQSDMFSVRGTALAAYRNELARQEAAGEVPDIGLAIDLGNRAVRRAHGSTAVTNRPAMVRGGGPLGNWMTSIYGFMGTIMQRRIEIAHLISDMYRLGRGVELNVALKKSPELASRIVTHVLLPIAVEEAVTGLVTDDQRGAGEHIAVALFDGLARSALYLRDIVYSLMGSHAPSVGLFTGPLDDFRKLKQDLEKGRNMFTGPQAGKLVGDTITALGIVRGYGTRTLGNLARFGINYARGYERPTLGDIYMAPARGTSQKRVVK